VLFEVEANKIVIYRVLHRKDAYSSEECALIMKLHPEILHKNGKKEFVILPYNEFVAIQERLNDAEDLMELRKAKRSEGKKKAIPLAVVKRKLRLR
jgi:hypothetical protein